VTQFASVNLTHMHAPSSRISDATHVELFVQQMNNVFTFHRQSVKLCDVPAKACS